MELIDIEKLEINGNGFNLLDPSYITYFYKVLPQRFVDENCIRESTGELIISEDEIEEINKIIRDELFKEKFNNLLNE